MKKGREVKSRRLVSVRIAWTTAFLVSTVAILGGLASSGTDGGDSSQPLPGYAFAEGDDSSGQFEFASFDPVAPVLAAKVQEKPQKQSETAAPQDATSVEAQDPGDGDSGSRVRQRTGGQPQGAGERGPSATPPPNSPQAPAVSAPALPQAPAVSAPEPEAPAVSAPEPPQGAGMSAPETPLATADEEPVPVSA